MEFEYPEGATPIDSDEAQGLRLTHITTQGELNRWEFQNIRDAEAWLAKRKFTADKLVTVDFARQLHKRMFGNVWIWAGDYRTSNKNIGVPREQIAVDLHTLCEDTRTWITSGSYQTDELAAQFHHRLVKIHPFTNGNGRHARLMADLLLERILGAEPFSWGSSDLVGNAEVRARYIAALRAADKYDINPLLEFVRS
jgi:Fic-DOC domain mobile mystery protein B